MTFQEALSIVLYLAEGYAEHKVADPETYRKWNEAITIVSQHSDKF